MSKRYRKVDTRIWNDRKFSELSDNGKLVFFFLLTHPHMTALGAMRATIPGMAAELNWSLEAFREAFLEASSKGMVKHDQKASFIWLPNFLKYNKPESPNVVKAWGDAYDLLPECTLKIELSQQVKTFLEGLSEPFLKALPEAFRKTSLNQEQEQEQEYKTLPSSFQKLDSENETSPDSTPQKNNKTRAKKKIPEKYFQFTREFYEYLANNGNGKQEYTRKEIENGAEALDKLVRLDRFNWENEVKPALWWAIEDDFWSAQIVSLAALRRKSERNGQTKFTNLFAKYSAKKSGGVRKKSKMEFVY